MEEPLSPSPAPRSQPARVGVIGVVVTFRRESTVGPLLESLAAQAHAFKRILVVDNGSSSAVRALVAAHPDVEYLDPGENTGPAGAMGLAYDAVAASAPEDAWLMRFDDDHVVGDRSLVAEMASFAATCTATDPRTAAVGEVGTRYDWRTGDFRRVPTQELHGAVPVDGLGSNHHPLYRLGPMRDVGPFDRRLFFGFTEHEYALRLRRAGYSLYANGDRWLASRVARTRPEGAPRRGDPTWRTFYSLRNQIWCMRQHDQDLTAARVALRRGLVRPLVDGWPSPSAMAAGTRSGVRAVRDGWRGRLGRTIDPAESLRPGEQAPAT